MAHHYDVFISHRGENKPWVRTLADNLEALGFRPFLDERELIPGGSVPEQLHRALADSAAGLVVATPESLESGWVRDEIDAMVSRRNRDSEFRLIPLTFGTVPDHAFLGNLLCVDFSDPSPAGYRDALQRTLCGLTNRPPREAPELPDPLPIPEPMTPRYREMEPLPLVGGEPAFLEEVFEALYSNQPVMLLAQAGRDKTAMHRAILEEARAHFGDDAVRHLVPLGQANAEEADYFTYLARQLDVHEPIASATAFEFLLDDRLAGGEPLFLLLTRLEDGNDRHRTDLARVLRNLSERRAGQLHLIFCGSERLAALRYEGGDLSPLNTAEQRFWPEPTGAEVQAQYRGDAPLEEGVAEVLLELTGGHPLLLHAALRHYRQRSTLEGMEELLTRENGVSSSFIRLREQGASKCLCSWLGEDRENGMGPYVHWPEEPLLRHLFWENLLSNQRGRFAWRSPLIRQIGQEILGC